MKASPDNLYVQGMNNNRNPSNESHRLLLYEKLFITMSVLMPLQEYQINFAGLGLSLDRSIFFLLIVLFPFYCVKRKTDLGLAQVLAICGITSLFISTVTGAGIDQYAIKFIPSMLQGYLIFGVGVYVFKDNIRLFKIVDFILVGWATVFCVFSVYTLYYFYIKNTTMVPYPFLGYVSDENIHFTRMLNSRRLFMPLGSAPHLGAVTVGISLFYLCVYMYCKKMYYMYISLGMMVVCIMTASRGPILAGLISLLILLVGGRLLGEVKIGSKIYGIIFASTLLFISIFVYSRIQEKGGGEKASDRLTLNVDEIRHGRHLELRIISAKIFIESSIMEKIGGSGFGAIAKTGYGDYSFMSNLTLLVETGLIGGITFSFIYIISLSIGFINYQRFRGKCIWYFYGACLIIFLQLNHSFYELKAVREIWMLTAVVYGLVSSRFVLLAEASFYLLPRSRK